MQRLSEELRDLIDNTSSNDEDVYLSGNLERPLFKSILADLDFASEARPLILELQAWGNGPDEDGSQYDQLVTLAMKLRALITTPEPVAAPVRIEFDAATSAKLSALVANGFTVGKRDPRVNSDYPGAFMVIEAHDESELPTRDGANGPWAIVGDDLAALIAEAHDVHAGFTFKEA